MSAAPARRPQLTADELQQLKWLLGGLLSLLGVSTVLYMDIDAWALMGLTVVATVATLVRPELPGRVPRLVHTLAFPAIAVFFAADLWLKMELLPAMVRLDILLLIYRNLAYRQRRDDLQIIVLGLFLIIVAGVLTVSLTFAAHLLVYTAGSLALLLVITLDDAANAGRRAPHRAIRGTPGWVPHADWPALLRRLRAVTDWRVVGLGLALFAGVVGVSALLFLAIPRFQIENSMFLDRFITKKSRSGFSDVIRFGDVSEIQLDTSIALSVDVSEQSQVPQTPYWRMLVLDDYSNGTFRLSATLRGQFTAERTAAFQAGHVRPRQGPKAAWTFYLESGVSRYLPLLGPFELLRFREAQNFRYAPNLALAALREDPVSMTAYLVDGFDLGPLLPDPTFAERWRQRELRDQRLVATQTRLLLGAGDLGRLRRTAAEITGGQALPAVEFARRAGDWLRTRHNYSLSPTVPAGDGDPLVRWLGSREAGHCELFAGAFVLLARAAGHPARVVTGFRGGSWNGYSNNFTIRNSEAHAWAEIFDETAGGWWRADPLTPATANQGDEVRGEAAVASRLDRSWAARLDSLRVFWYRRIVSFDQRSQAETLKAVKEATQHTGRALREVLEEAMAGLRAWLATPWDVTRVARGLGLVGALAVLVWGWRELGPGWWRRWWRSSGRGQGDPVRREAGRWLARLRRLPVPDPASAAAIVIADLQRLRFGAEASWPDPAGVWRRARQVWREARRQGAAISRSGTGPAMPADGSSARARP
jgi:transglutaminase-like putative cysteine protease